MKRFMQITLAAVVTMIVLPVLAQERQQGSRFDLPGTFFLLTQKSVQEELRLTDEQIKKITGWQEKARNDRSESKGLKGEQLRKKLAERIKAENEFINNLLKQEQLKRLKQISLQQHLRALAFLLSRTDIAQSLELTGEQREKIAEIRKESTKRILGVGRLDAEGRKKIQEISKETKGKALAVLTTEQKRKLLEMMGTPFKGEIARPFRSRRQDQENQGSRK